MPHAGRSRPTSARITSARVANSTPEWRLRSWAVRLAGVSALAAGSSGSSSGSSGSAPFAASAGPSASASVGSSASASFSGSAASSGSSAFMSFSELEVSSLDTAASSRASSASRFIGPPCVAERQNASPNPAVVCLTPRLYLIGGPHSCRRVTSRPSEKGMCRRRHQSRKGATRNRFHVAPTVTYDRPGPSKPPSETP